MKVFGVKPFFQKGLAGTGQSPVTNRYGAKSCNKITEGPIIILNLNSLWVLKKYVFVVQ